MNYWLHPLAAEEHKKQIAYYEHTRPGLGRRYHAEFLDVAARVCAKPLQSRIVHAPDLRSALFKVFQFELIYREVGGDVQILAIAHRRRQPGYWLGRL